MAMMNDTNSTVTTQNDGCTLSDEDINNSYNLKLRIVSVFVLLIVSFLGAFISVASTRFKSLHINPIIINTGKFFGSGVVLATGFVHILPDAMAALTDPCLPNSWNAYSAYAGLFAMLAALAMHLIEFLGHLRYRSMGLKHTHITVQNDVKECTMDEHTHGKVDESMNKVNNETDKTISVGHLHDEKEKTYVNGKGEDIQNTEQTYNHTGEHEQIESVNETKRKTKKRQLDNTEVNNPEHTQETNDKIEEPEQMPQTNDGTEKSKEKETTHDKSHKSEHMEEGHNHSHELGKKHHDVVSIEIVHMEPSSGDLYEASGHHHGIAFQDDSQSNAISTYLLELGIALHSVLIGLTLGTTTDSFVALFIALCFHQFFEAIALGAQIAHVKTVSIKSAFYMVIFFALTTPVGIAIGIGVHSGIYNPKSVSSLLVTGILDSLSAGVLIYVALVNLITAEMGANAHAFFTLRTRLKLLYFGALYLGVAGMSVIGRWA